DVAAACVVNAAGAWAAHVGALAGADVPVAPLRRQVACTVATGVLPATMPMTIYAGDGFHFRVRDGRVLLLLPSEGADDPFDDAVDRSWVERVARVAHERVPALRGVVLRRPVRDVAGRACDPRCRAGRAELLSRQRLFRTRRHARARARHASRRAHRRRARELARRRAVPARSFRRRARAAGTPVALISATSGS